MALVINPFIIFIYLHRNPYPLVFRCLRESGLTAFFTRSSAANIPVNMAFAFHSDAGTTLNDSIIGKNNHPYPERCSFCLETQHFPDSPNKPEYPSTRLNPDETFRSTTVYKFSVIK